MKCSVITGEMVHGNFCFMVRGVKDFHPEFMRGKISSSLLDTSKRYNFHTYSGIPSFMDLMRFVGFSFECGKTVFDGRFIDTESAKAPITDMLGNMRGTHVLVNIG